MSNENHLQILGYGTFYDVPRGLFVKVGKQIAHLRCEFDDVADDYRDYYDVYLVQGLTVDDFYTGFAYRIPYSRVQIGQIPLTEIKFDFMRRKSIQSPTLENLINAHSGSQAE